MRDLISNVFRYLQQLVTAQGARNRELEQELKAYRDGSALQNDSSSTVTLNAGTHAHPNGTGKLNEKKKKRRGLVKKTRKVMTTCSDTTASLEREGDAEGEHDEHEHDESSDAEAEAEVDFDENGLMGMGMNMGAGIGMGDMGSPSFHGGDAAAAMSGMIGEMGMGMGMMSTMAAVMGGMGGMGMVMPDGMRYGNGNGNGNVGSAGARGRRAVRGSGPQQVQGEELGESMEVDEESLRGRTSTRGSAAGSGVGTPACVVIDGKRPQNGIMTNGNAHPNQQQLIIMNGDGAASPNGVNGSETMRLKEETMDELLGVGVGGGGAGMTMASLGGGMNGVSSPSSSGGRMGVGVVGMEMMGLGMQA